MGLLNKTSVDLVGKQINYLYVEDWSYSEQRKCNAWKCKCTCGKEVFRSTYELTKGNAKSCGCMDFFIKSQAKMKDLTGMRFGRLLVLEEIKERSYSPQGLPQIKYKCLCDCGNIVEVYGSNLRKGNTKSCGCFNSEAISNRRLKDLTGQRFGLLTVIKRAPDYISPEGRHQTMWLCKCDCGREVAVNTNSLKKSLTKSCGCIRNSYGEHLVKKYLDEAGIKYQTEYTFSDLVTENGYCMRFDFALLKEDKTLICLIEYQGLQHYVDYAYGSESFGKYQREVTDIMKKEYCKSKNIKLYEIKYNEDVKEAVTKIINQINNANMSIPCQAS